METGSAVKSEHPESNEDTFDKPVEVQNSGAMMDLIDDAKEEL